jgi:hypothetical protein
MRTRAHITAAEFRSCLKAEPFRRFVVRTKDGGALTIARPDRAMISPLGTEVVFYDKNEDSHALPMSHVIALEITGRRARRNDK